MLPANVGDDILRSLGEMHVPGGAFTDDSDRAGGAGTAAFVNAAIRSVLSKRA